MGRQKHGKHLKGTSSDVLTIQMTFGFVCVGVQRAFMTQPLLQEVGKSTEKDL